MRIDTKFDIGSKVWYIHHNHERTWIPCPACEGTGNVTLANGTRSCPECYGRMGEWKLLAKKWMLGGYKPWYEPEVFLYNPMTVGQVRVEVEKKSFEERYMCRETGIGSGTLWKAEDLFALEAEALAACDERNLVLDNANVGEL